MNTIGLTKKHFGILDAYITNSHLTQRGLAEITNQSVGNMNRLVKELVDDNLVSDGRITADGLAALEPYRLKRAAFLAAGVGSRLMLVTLNTPKPLVRVKGKRIIDGLIDEVLALGIQEIYIVRGYLGEQFDQILSLYPMVQFLENPIYNESNNISSVMCARYLLSNTNVFEADLIIRPGLLRRYHYTSTFLATYQERCDDWCFKAKDGVIVEEKLGDYDAWRNCGISYWTKMDGKELAEHIKIACETPGGKELFWEQVPLNVFKSTYQVAIQACSEQVIKEIDTYKELKATDDTYSIR